MNRYTLQRLTRLGTQAGLAMAVAAALTLPTRANAGSFQLPTDNAAGWARANAGGSLFPDDPTAAYNNPAAMAFFDATMLQVTGTGIRPSSQFHGQFNDVNGIRSVATIPMALASSFRSRTSRSQCRSTIA